MSRHINKVQVACSSVERAECGRGGGDGSHGRGQGPARSLLTAPPSRPASSSRLARRAPRRSARESGPRTGRQPSSSLCQLATTHSATRPRAISPLTLAATVHAANYASLLPHWIAFGLQCLVRLIIILRVLCDNWN